MVNTPALVSLLQAALWRPGLLVPHATVTDIRALDWKVLYDAGVRAVICDKDNCLTKPKDDSLAAPLQQSWQECRFTFGSDRVIIVSNSAGSSNDSGGIGAESLSRHLQVPVLAHRGKKPARSCVRDIVGALNALNTQDPSSSRTAGEAGRVLVIGDRPSTDVVLAHRLDTALRRLHLKRRSRAGVFARLASPSSTSSAEKYETPDPLSYPSISPRRPAKYSPNGPPYALAVLTTTLWARERIGTRLMRSAENATLAFLNRRGVAPRASWLSNAEVSAQAAQGSSILQSSIAARAEFVRRVPARGQNFDTQSSIDAAAAAERDLHPREAPIISSSTLTPLPTGPTLLEALIAQPVLPRWLVVALRGSQRLWNSTPTRFLRSHLHGLLVIVGRGLKEGTSPALRSRLGWHTNDAPKRSRTQVWEGKVAPADRRAYSTCARRALPRGADVAGSCARRRAYSNQGRREESKSSKPDSELDFRKRANKSFLKLLILSGISVPLCFYLGVKLSEMRHPEVEEAKQSELVLSERAAHPDGSAPSGTAQLELATGPTSLKENAANSSSRNAAAERELYHLQRELRDVNSKLDRLQRRDSAARMV